MYVSLRLNCVSLLTVLELKLLKAKGIEDIRRNKSNRD